MTPEAHAARFAGLLAREQVRTADLLAECTRLRALVGRLEQQLAAEKEQHLAFLERLARGSDGRAA